MTNEQYSNIMIAFAKLETKIENLQAAFSELLEAPIIENKLAVTGDIKPEHLSNFWNEDQLKKFGCIGDNSIPPKPFFSVEKEENEDKFNFKNSGRFHIGATLDDNCIWETIPAEQRDKPMGISCPCKRCSTHSMGIRE